MGIRHWYKRLSVTNKFYVWGSAASMLALLFAIYAALPSRAVQSGPSAVPATVPSSPKNLIAIMDITLSSRNPIWDNESLSQDEIVVNISGQANVGNGSDDWVVVAFWRLANAYETNWHIGRHRVGGNYKLAKLEAALANAGEWNFLVGGIECEKTYKGDIAIVLLAYPLSEIEKNAYEWLREQQRMGWGFTDIPKGFVASSAVKTLQVSKNRT